MTLEAGDIVLCPFPNQEGGLGKVRPSLVVSRAAYNHASGDVLACPMTSRLEPKPYAVPMLRTEMAEGILLVDSLIRVNRVYSLSSKLIAARVGRVDVAVLRRVVHELVSIIARPDQAA